MRIAVDVGALSGPADGIGRYLRSLLPRCMRLAGDDAHWTLLGRADHPPAAGWPERTLWRGDRLPAGIGRPLSLLSSQPWWLRSLQPDLLFGPAHRLPLAIPAGTARVLTVHDLCWVDDPGSMRAITRRLDAWFMPRAIAAADRIIAVSEFTANRIRDCFPQAAPRVVTIPEAAETLPAPAAASALERWNVRAPYALFVGTLQPRKNLDRLLQAFAALPGELREATQLVVIGAPGWGGVNLDERTRELGIATRVVHLPAVDDAALSTLLAHARLLALPSLYEGFGLPLLEAMSQGTPVLASSTSAMPEVAGAAGLLVDPLQVNAISGALQRLLLDDALHARLAAAARPQAALFSWERAAAATLAVFREALAERSAGRG